MDATNWSNAGVRRLDLVGLRNDSPRVPRERHADAIRRVVAKLRILRALAVRSTPVGTMISGHG